MSDRILRLTSPLMHGTDVAGHQRDLNEWLVRWHGPSLEADGQYGVETAHRMRSIAYAIGIATGEIDKGATPAIRRKIRNPKLRNPADLVRSRTRKDWLKRFKASLGGNGPERALAVARSHLGEKENPPGSNNISYAREFGIVGAPWCGAFVGHCLRVAGVGDIVARRIVFVPWIVADGHSGSNGMLKVVSVREATLGDIVCFEFDQRQPRGDHTGLVERNDGGVLYCIEGNTIGEGMTGSQADGGMVARRRRSSNILAVVRPRYR